MVLLAIDIVLLILLHISRAEEEKWVWGRSRSYKNGGNFNNYDSLPSAASRYEVYEGDNHHRPYPNNHPYSPDYTPIQRPGGVYGPGSSPGSNYGQGGHGSNNPNNPGILTGPVPSWVRDNGPIKDFDRCKCTEKFNCPSPGISYGHCDVGKQYCCFSTKKLTGGPVPNRPVHSAENGVLVGPGGPFDGPRRPGFADDQRPGSFAQNQRPGGFGLGANRGERPDGFGGRPGGFGGRPGGFGHDRHGNGRPGEFGLIGGGNGNRRPVPHYENGVLVGPGGPFDGDYGRSAKN